MKRFWTDVTVERGAGGFRVALDDRPLRTPARATLEVPTDALAQAIATEWRDAGEQVDPRAMPLTGLANAAIDHVTPNPETFAASIARFGESDLLCYRAEGPRPLVEHQSAAWDPLLDWARRRYDIDFATSDAVMHVAQPDATVRRLAHAVAKLDAFRLAALSPLVSISGSLVIGLAVAEQAVTAAVAWDAASVDERWQLDQWGSDAEAESALAGSRAAFFAAASFLLLL